ncbi:unnamed protein product [Caenorhabditis sp. 36 PRJEB53466]|nr:unnamed protein product [Caenorhabditis sp. 36 PRJEB53466]
MAHSSMICVLVVLVLAADAKKECSTECPLEERSADLGLVLPPELYESTRLVNLLARPSQQFKMKRDYDFVRFGRSAPSKKASYDYIRFGRK